MNKRLHDRVAGLENGDRTADRGRLGGKHGRGELAQGLVVVGIAARLGLDTHQAVLGLPAAHQIGRQIIQADRLGLHRVLELIEHDLQRGDEDALGFFARGLIGIGKPLQVISQPPRSYRSRSFGIARGLAQTFRRSLQGVDIFCVRRRIIHGFRIKRRIENLGSLRNQLQLFRLIFRHETVQRDHVEHFRQLRKLGLDLFRIGFRIRHHVDGVGAGVRIFSQVEERGDRFNVGIAQMHRVEVEVQEVKQRQAGNRDQQGSDDDDDAVLFQEMIDRGQKGIADRIIFSRRVKQAEQGRQYGDAR